MSSDDCENGAILSELAGTDLADLVEEFVDALPARVATIQAAIDDADLAALASIAHQLKGSAGGYGFPSITAAAGVVELGARGAAEMKAIEEQARSLIELCGRARASA